MNTDDLEQPFRDRPMNGNLDVARRSVVLLRELATVDAKFPDTETSEIAEPAQAALGEASAESGPETNDESPAESVPVMANPLPTA
jgi:hypothetical protein